MEGSLSGEESGKEELNYRLLDLRIASRALWFFDRLNYLALLAGNFNDFNWNAAEIFFFAASCDLRLRFNCR
jgi:hypothetical protein